MFNLNTIKIGVFDSGIGGLTVLNELKKTLPFGELFYLGDNANTPYGNKSNTELLRLAVSGVNKLISYGANVVVIACNTLSLSVLSHLSRIFYGVHFFGVFPPVESFFITKSNYLVLATASSVSSLKKRYPNVNAFALPNLAKDIENNIYNLKAVNLSKHLVGVDNFYGKVILGCTHYAFLQAEFEKYFNTATVLSSGKLTASIVANFVKSTCFDHFSKKIKINFIGDFADKNFQIFDKFYSKT